MPFEPEVGQRLVIGAMQYQVCEHPMARGMPYGQEGRAGIVYKLSPVAGSACALKVFNPRNRDPSLVNLASHLDQFATMPGLSACRHSILTPRTDGQLLREFPDLMYAAMMRWIPGYTWADTMQGNEELTAAESLRLAHGLAEGLQRMEERGLAHCDLSGANVLLPDLAPDTCNATHPVELVDVEQMYAADLPRPRVLPAGSPGYAHRSVSAGDWSPRSDRFAGALLLAEILGWCDSTARSYGAGETFFDPSEIQDDESQAYRQLRKVLDERWGPPVRGLLDQAWHSETLADCPSFGDWMVALPESSEASRHDAATARVSRPATATATPTPVTVTTDEDNLQQLLARAELLVEKGDLAAIDAFRAARALAQPGSSLADELELIIRSLEVPKRASANRRQLPLLAGLLAIAGVALLGLAFIGYQLSNAGQATASDVATQIPAVVVESPPTAEPTYTPTPIDTPTPLPTQTPIPTATPAPPTTDELWSHMLGELDAKWSTDWPASIDMLSAFVAAYPDYQPAKDKLYIARLFYAKALVDVGDTNDAVAQLQSAQSLQPDRHEADAALVALTPTPVPSPTPAPVVVTQPTRAVAPPVSRPVQVAPTPVPAVPTKPPAPQPTVAPKAQPTVDPCRYRYVCH